MSATKLKVAMNFPSTIWLGVRSDVSRSSSVPRARSSEKLRIVISGTSPMSVMARCSVSGTNTLS